jgi:hypothetical protein
MSRNVGDYQSVSEQPIGPIFKVQPVPLKKRPTGCSETSANYSVAALKSEDLKTHVTCSRRQFCTSASYHHQPATLNLRVLSCGWHRQPATQHRPLLCTNRHRVTVQNKKTVIPAWSRASPLAKLCVYTSRLSFKKVQARTVRDPLPPAHNSLGIYSTTRAQDQYQRRPTN